MMVHYAKLKEEWMALLEICCYSVECAVTAQQRGLTALNCARHRKKGVNALVRCVEVCPSGCHRSGTPYHSSSGR